MYCRTITFTLPAPSIWLLIEAVAKTGNEGGYNRFLMRADNDSGVVIETFEGSGLASTRLEVLRALQALNEQAMAKIGVPEGDLVQQGPGARPIAAPEAATLAGSFCLWCRCNLPDLTRPVKYPC